MRSDELLSPPCLLAFFLFCFVAFVAGCHSFFVLLLVCLLAVLSVFFFSGLADQGFGVGASASLGARVLDPSLKALLGSFSGLADQGFGAGALASLGQVLDPSFARPSFFFDGKHTPSVRAFLKSRVI